MQIDPTNPAGKGNNKETLDHQKIPEIVTFSVAFIKLEH